MSGIWAGVDRLLDGAESEAGVAGHGLQLLAIRRWRETGRPVPQAWLDDQRLMAMVSLALPGLLREIRAAVAGPIILMKGPEVATLYPSPAMRPFGDLDLLVEDAPAAQRALLGLGLAPYDGHWDEARSHHRRPLLVGSLPLRIEVHESPNWLPWLTPPVRELFDGAVPSRLGIAGVSTLAPAHHAVAVAVHGWRHGPLLTVGHLVDLTLLAGLCDADELVRLAERWRVRRIWETSRRAADALLLGDGHSLPLAIGGRHLRRVRERSLAGLHVSGYVGTLWAPTPPIAARALRRLVRDTVGPADGQSWPQRAIRLARLLPVAARPISRAQDVDR